MQAVILAGGAGTRLGPLTEQTPKPLLAVGDRPFLEWLLLNLERYHFDSVIVLAGYHGNTTRSFVENRRSRLPVSVLVEPEPQGTGGAILQARELLEPEFL
ncbi:NDP-sugar synthase, partial [candidate division WOR-3 bacterium]|nr:NDP-sugar synthase [candidate division WOR-3 bacterium]